MPGDFFGTVRGQCMVSVPDPFRLEPENCQWKMHGHLQMVNSYSEPFWAGLH